MKENSIKKEQSSIEENIEILEKFKNNEMQRDKLERDGRCGGWKIGDIYKCLELDNAIGNILSDYKRVLKENEILKEEKEQVWEEWNNLEQGSYETEQRLKRELKGQVIKIEEITKLNQELVKENKIQDRIINKICNYICCTNYEDKIKIKEDDIVYYGEVGSIRKYFEDKIRKDK